MDEEKGTNDLAVDVIVVGAGIEGSATALNLVDRGKRVLLLEQYPLPHSRGSSHGQTRVTRKAYTDDFYTHMMELCTEQWRLLEKRSGQAIFKQAGYLAIGEIGGEFLDVNIRCMTRHNAPFQLLQPSEFSRKFPMLKYGKAIGGLFDPEGGILMADKALKAMQTLFSYAGGTIKDSERFESMTPGETITVRTSKGSYRCRSLILTCGPWTNKVLAKIGGPTLPLTPVKINVCYWPELTSGSHSAAKLPTFYDHKCCDGHSIYGLPSEEYPGLVKLCLHSGPEIDIESRDIPDSQWTLKLLKEYVREHFPGLRPVPSIVESCVYTNTPDGHFVLDKHPLWDNVIVGAGFSGHGFKLAPAVGQILGDIALKCSSKFDVRPFKYERFKLKTEAKL